MPHTPARYIFMLGPLHIMPSHAVHRRLYPGRPYPDVDSWMDEPSKWLGSRHRVLRHSIPELWMRYPGDWERIKYGAYHILLDNMESSSPEMRRALRTLDAILRLRGEV
jgi:hypothetical protein